MNAVYGPDTVTDNYMQLSSTLKNVDKIPEIIEVDQNV